MKRREFIAGLGGAAVWPVVVRAQQPAVPVIGYLSLLATDGLALTTLDAFRQGLRDAGYVEGQNVAIEYRSVERQFDRYPATVADLLGTHPAVIFANGPIGVRAVMAATSTIPIVFFMGEDPVAEGVVESLSRPARNVTGFTDFSNQLVAKRFGLLCDAVPQAAVIAVLANPTHNNAATEIAAARIAAEARGREMRVLEASTENDLVRAFGTMASERVGALLVLTDPFLTAEHERIISLAARYRIPAIYERREIPRVGGLMSYGVDRLDAQRQSGIYVGRILRGEKPTDLPVQQASKFEFVLNMKAATALGLAIPPGILSLADEVIE